MFAHQDRQLGIHRAFRAALVAAVTAGAVIAGSSSVPALAATPPVVTSFSPGSGSIGTQVTVTGSGFTGATAVKFNGVASLFKVSSNTKITATVPVTASTGPLTVTTAGGTGTGATAFTVGTGIVLWEAGGHPGGTVAVSGAGFGAHEAVDVYFDTGDEALVTTSGTGNFGPTTIAVPDWATPGSHWISAIGRRTGLADQAAYVVGTNWSQLGYSARHAGFNPHENVLSPYTVGGINLDWSFPAHDAFSTPVAANGIVYFGSNFDLDAVNAASGAKLWSFSTQGDVESSPAVAGGLVYVGSVDHNLYALNASTGALVWHFTATNSVTSPPTVAAGVVYFGTQDGKVYALNAATGASLWTFDTGVLESIQSAPAVANGVVYFGSNDIKLYALDAATGAQLWTFATGSFIASSPAVANGVVYIGSEDGRLYAVNAANGTQLWNFDTNGMVVSSPAVANGTVYVGSADHTLYAFSTAGAELWSFTTSGPIEASPEVANGVVYINSYDSNAYAVDAVTGAELWSATTGGIVFCSPIEVNGTLYVASEDGNLYAYDQPAADAGATRPAISKLRPSYSPRARR